MDHQYLFSDLLAAQGDNVCGVPDSMDIYIYAGDGAYTLYEGGEGERIEFHAQVHGQEKQTLTIQNSRSPKNYHIFFKNVEDGSCKLLTGGREAPVAVRHNRCLQAIFELGEGETAELTAAWQTPDPAAALRAEVLKSFIQIPQDNWYKEKRWETGRGIERVEEWEKWIRSLDISDLAKSLLKEKLYAMSFQSTNET